MKVTYMLAREVGDLLQELMRTRDPKELPSTTEWGRKRKGIVKKFLFLIHCIEHAAAALNIETGPGRPHALPLATRA